LPVVTATTLMTRAVILMATNEQVIDPIWILCDNESTVDIAKNKDMLMNIHKTNKPIQLIGIGGCRTVGEQEGDLPGYGTVYLFHPFQSDKMIQEGNV
jgi:hypothetical protein